MEAKRSPLPSRTLMALRIVVNLVTEVFGLPPVFKHVDPDRARAMGPRFRSTPPSVHSAALRPASFEVKRRDAGMVTLDDGRSVRHVDAAGVIREGRVQYGVVPAVAEEFVGLGFFDMPSSSQPLEQCDLIVTARVGARQRFVGVAAGDPAEQRRLLERIAQRVEDLVRVACDGRARVNPSA
jgi:hypothetical protein